MKSNVLEGTVQSGAAGTVLLPNVPVTLYRATAGDPVVVGQATTDANGAFRIAVSDPTADTIFYATATYRPRVVLVAIVGPRVLGPITINEMTTVAAAYSMAQFSDGTRIAGDAFGLRIAAGMNDNLAAPRTGLPSLVLLTPPNAKQTNALGSICSLANLVAECIRRPASQETFFHLTTPPGGSPPADTFQAVHNIARHPAHNAGALFTRSLEAQGTYGPTVFQAPNAWTLAVKVNDSGSEDYMFGGPANIAFDRDGYAWIANNVVQGTPNSGTFIMVLQPDGKPARGVGERARSPVFGGGLKGPGWGITISPTSGHVWVGNFGWGVRPEYPHHGSVSEFLPDGTPVSGEHGYQEHTHRVQATVSDAQGNIWMASYGNDRVVVYLKGNPKDARWMHSGSRPFGVAIDNDGNAWVTNGAGLGWPDANQGTVTRFRIDENGQLVKTLDVPVGLATKVIVTDSLGNAWLASSGDSKVYQVTSTGAVVGQGYSGGGIDTPWGLAVDGNDNIWVSNFGVMGPGNDYSTAALSHLRGANAATEPQNVAPGTPLSPPKGYQLPTGGDPVLLANGQPLYTDGPECYYPMMRSTSCQIDQAGNVWVVNNWKPRFGTDFEPGHGNPGGDGIVIFVGLAKPPVLSS